MNYSFINQFVKEIISLQEQHEEVCVVIPSKRAKIFILNTYKKACRNVFLPKIITIEEFIEEVTELSNIDQTNLLLEFFNFYKVNSSNESQTFASFVTWAKTLLYDFKDIDGYLISTERLFPYLQEIKAIERWELKAEDQTELIKKQLAFWYGLPELYTGFYTYLLNNKIGHSGLIQRETTKTLKNYLKNTKQFFVFGGFNALNNAEQFIFQTILTEQRGLVLWDIDVSFLNEKIHLAGHFINKFKNNWSYYKHNPLSGYSDYYKKPKNIHIYKTIKSIGQAKLVSHILNKYDLDVNQTTVVLPDESLLLPILNHLPDKIDALNITMGYPAINNPIQFLIHDFFKLHLKAKKTNKNESVFYFKHVLSILQNPNIIELTDTRSVINHIKQFNINYITFNKIKSIATDDQLILDLLFGFTFQNNLDFLNKIDTLIKLIKKRKENNNNHLAKIDLSFLYSLYQMVNQLKSYLQKYAIEDDCRLLFELYQDQVSQAQVAFEGQPLQGLQIMGMLESRMLDFETVIIPSCNEGILPPKPRQQSIVPFDVKIEHGMPTQLEQDALITYHFYRLISKAKNIFLIYDGDEGQGINTGEKSRFIEQIIFDNFSNHQIIQKSFVPNIQLNKAKKGIVKNEEVMQLIKIFAEKGFSASSFSAYLRNPKMFFINNILNVKQIDEVEEDIALNTLGSIIHKTLENLYQPHINEVLNESVIKHLLLIYENELIKNFQDYFKDGDLTKGKNLVALEISKKQVKQFLLKELEALKNGDDIVILALEENYKIEINDERFHFPVFLKGNLDRLERRNGVIGVLDYKTGKVESSHLALTETKKDQIFSVKNEKIMQLLCYATLLNHEYPNEEIQAGIISFRNQKEHKMYLLEKEKRQVINDVITPEILQLFQEQLKDMIVEIINPEIPFEDLA